MLSQFVHAVGGNSAPDFILKGGVAFRLVIDSIGSVRLVVNTQTGAIVQRLDYDEFGRVLADSNPGFQPFGFAGGIYEPETGLVLFGSRDYDPELGRWLVKDPLNFRGGQANLYAYVGEDPVNFRDATGAGPYNIPSISLPGGLSIPLFGPPLLGFGSPTLPVLPDLAGRRKAMDAAQEAIINGANDKDLGNALAADQSTRATTLQQTAGLTMQGAQAEVSILTQAGVAGVQPFQTPINNVPSSPLEGENVLTGDRATTETANAAVRNLSGTTANLGAGAAVARSLAGGGGLVFLPGF